MVKLCVLVSNSGFCRCFLNVSTCRISFKSTFAYLSLHVAFHNVALASMTKLQYRISYLDYTQVVDTIHDVHNAYSHETGKDACVLHVLRSFPTQTGSLV